MRRLLLVLIPLSLAAGCSHRPRLNPFDPGNPITHGRPANFVALAGNASVTLRWDAAGVSGLVGYVVTRRVDDSTQYVPIAPLLPPSATSWQDFGLANDIDHHYRIAYVFEGGTSTLTAEDVATPGPLLPWVADADAARLDLLTADGRHVARQLPLHQSAVSIDVDPSDGRVWACDADAGIVYQVDPATGTTTPLAPISEPVAVAVSRLDHTAWIADYGNGALWHLAPDGSLVTSTIASIDGPLDVAVAPAGDVWVCEHDGNRLRHFSSDGGPIGAVSVISPSRVTVDSLTRDAWVTSFARGTVIRVSQTPAAADSIEGLDGPIGVAVDARRRHVWVAEALGGTVSVFAMDGTRVGQVTGLAEPREVAIDPSTGNAWIVEYEGRRVTIARPDGTVLRQLANAGGLWDIALDDVRLRTSSPLARAR